MLLVEDTEEGLMRIGAGEPRDRSLLGASQDVLAVAPAHGLRLARRLEQLRGVLADRLEHREAWLARRPPQRTDEALVDERREGLEYVEPVPATDRLGRLEGPTARKDGKPREQRRLVLAQEAVAPFERRAQRPLPAWEVLRAADKKFERAVEAPSHRLRRQELRACRRQLDREGQPVEPRAHLRDCSGVSVVELELGVDGAGSRGEEAHGVVRGQLLEAQARAGFRWSEWRHRVLVLRGEPERRAARGEHEQPRRGRQQTGDEPDVRHELLEVVEQEQHAPVAEVGREHVLQRLARLADLERLGERVSEQRRILHRREVDEDDAVAQLRSELLRGCDRKPRLARAARAGERDQTHVVAPQERRDRGHLEATTHQRCRRRGQLHAHGRGRLRCRERGVVAQDPALELLELRAGVHAELLDEQLTGRPAGGERVGLPSRAVERKCMLRARVLAVRLGRDQPLQLGHELVMAAERELGVVEEVDGS